MKITIEDVKDFTGEQFVELHNNNMEFVRKKADGEGVKRSYSIIDEITTATELDMPKGLKSSDRVKFALDYYKTGADKLNSEIELLKKEPNEALDGLKSEIAQKEKEFQATKNDFENFKIEVEAEKKQAVADQVSRSINSKIKSKLSKGFYGEGVVGVIKDAFIESQISKINATVNPEFDSLGKLQFRNKKTGDIIVVGKTNARASILDVAKLDNDFKDLYSEKKDTNNKFEFKKSNGQDLSSKEFLEHINTLNISEKDKFKMISSRNKENRK